MSKDWPEHTALVGKSFDELSKNRPKMLQAYGALERAVTAKASDAETRELITIAVAITAHYESCISVRAAAATRTDTADSEIVGALATAISLNADAAYTYTLRALEAVETQR